MNASVLDIAQKFLGRVRKSGNENVMAICPFHTKADGSPEKSPSFAMNIYSGLWFCHSCKERGNLRSFLRDVGVARADVELYYGGAIAAAEEHAPPPPHPLAPTEPTKEPLEESLLGLFDFCPTALLEGDEHEAGFPEELLRKFDVGFDATHERITFPLRDRRGRLVGISGRAITRSQSPRYKLYDKEYLDFGLPERTTEKRVLLWNFHHVLAQAAFEVDPTERYVVVAEGFKAVMRIAQAGISNVTGLLGSYMAPEQMWQLSKLGYAIILMLDNDGAGLNGLEYIGRQLIKTVPNVFVAGYDAPQPSYLTPAAILDSIRTAQPFASWSILNRSI